MRKFLLFAGLAVLVVNGAQAHMGATGVVLERMEAMKEIASAVKAIKGQLSSDSYSSNVVIENASIIEKHAGKNFINLFPKGSDGDQAKQVLLFGKTGMVSQKFQMIFKQEPLL